MLHLQPMLFVSEEIALLRCFLLRWLRPTAA
jgi:hypothetical protein